VRDAIHELYKLRIRKAVGRLKERYPEFLYPLSRLRFQDRKEKGSDPTIANCLSTDGRTVFYDKDYMDKHIGKKLEYDIMHIVLHGMLGHFSHQKSYENKEYRDSCMDMQVLYFMHRLGMSGSDTEEELIRKSEETGTVDYSMRQYYRALGNERFAKWLLWYKNKIYHDNHREWDYKECLEQLVEEAREELNRFWKEARRYAGVTEGEDREASMERLALQNRLRCEKGKGFGSTKEGIAGQFGLGKATVRNYRELLWELSVLREVCREQTNSIDPMLYQYGFSLNEDSPLIEPTEYSEQSTMDLLVIAIDVSGSCADEETMGKFWGETYECISQWGRNGYCGEFLLLQCNDVIQKEEWLQPEEVTEVPEKVSVLGFGGTDFRPVFERLEQLKEEGRKVDALLYLTDGEGRYPQEKPEYPVYFVMPGADYDRDEERHYLPEWIEKVRLEEENV